MVTDLSAILAVFDPDTVHRLTTDRVIRRGESYRNAGAVEITALTTTAVTAEVQGTHRYEVRFDVSDHADWSCTCPAAADGDFCKHCVAVAAELFMIDAEEVDPPLVLPADAPPSRSPRLRSDRDGDDGWERRRLVEHLQSRSTERLVALIVEQTDVDWTLRERLLLEADTGKSSVDLDRWFRRIDKAMFVDDYVDWRDAEGWASAVHFVIEAIGELLANGHAEATIPLAEYAFRAVERAVGYVDDSDSGCLRDISERIGDLHFRACEARPPDPVMLARSLIDLELNSELEGLYHAVETYTDLLGDDGMAEYGRLLDALGTGSTGSDRAYAVKSMRRAYVSALNDTDALVAELAVDPGPADVVAIIKALAEAGRADEAIEAGRAGLGRLCANRYSVSGVIDTLAELLNRCGHVDEAISLYRDDFEASPSLTSLKRLLDAVDRDRDACLDGAIAHVRNRVGVPRAGHPNVTNDVLVEILTWAGRHDEAWDAATAAGCTTRRWMELAEHREPTHPIDAIDVYEPQIARSIEAKNNQSYAAAVDLMARVDRLATAAGVPGRFDELVEIARTIHKPKRNLQKLLDQRGW